MNFRIRKYDERNWVIEELATGGLHPVTRQPGPDKWKVIGYYGKLTDLLTALLSRQAVAPHGTLEAQIPALLAEIRAAEKRIIAALKEPVAV